MKVDLHIHTTASDGSWTPGKLIKEVCSAGIGLFSITDHDTVDNVIITRQLADRNGLFFLSGVEISTTVRGQSFHILGYGIDPSCKSLQRVLQHNTLLMEESDHYSIKKLISEGLPIDYDEYMVYKHDPNRGGWKALSYLIDKGLCIDVGDFFANLYTAKRGISFPEFLPPRDVIEVIMEAGGVPVLAHPGSSFHKASLEDTLDYFGREDIHGIECYHPSHDALTTKRALEWCERHRLLVTGGSDCHGDFVASRCLGVPDITLSQIKLGSLAEKLAIS